MPADTEPAVCCGRCEQVLTGRFCHGCGLRAQQGRVSLPQLLRDGRERLFDWEQGFLRTSRDLLLRPGTLLRAVLAGRRQRYSHPLSYLLVSATLAILVAQSYDEAFWAMFRESMLQNLRDAKQVAEFGPEHAARYVQVYETLSAFLPYWMLVFTLPIAGLMRLLFWRQPHTVAEFWLAGMYTCGLAILFNAGLDLVIVLAKLDPQFLIRQMAPNVLILASMLYGIRSWLGGGLGTLLRLLLAVVIGFVGVGLLQNALAVGYAYWGG